MTDSTDLQDVHKEVNAEGLICPEPVMLLHSAVRDAKDGDRIKLLATDPSTKKDISNFCEFLGHTLEHFEEREGQYIYWVRKGLVS
jgi:tRNA 2-thiouridine synthesizing protein A